jgi:hypothetical protein
VPPHPDVEGVTGFDIGMRLPWSANETSKPGVTLCRFAIPRRIPDGERVTGVAIGDAAASVR